MSLLDKPLCSFSSSATPLEPLLVVEWRGEEAISKPYRFEIKLASLNPLLDDEAMLGQPATLKLTDAKGNAQPYHGVVTEAELLDSDGQYFYFNVVLEPRMALLRQSRFSEIWLDKNLPDLIRGTLSEAGLQSEGPGTSGGEADSYDFDIRLAADDLALKESSFTCQFEESSFAFLSRLLEYYGVYYFFEQQDDHEAIVFCGDQRYQPQSETLLNYRPLDTALDAGSGIALTRTFNRRLASQPKQVVVQDFSASNASLELFDSASIARGSLALNASAEQSESVESAAGFSGEQWLYGEHFGSNQEGQTLANLRAEEVGCRHREFHGNGRAVGLRAGYPMRLIGHLRLPLNTQYLIIQVQHDGSQPLPGLGQDQAGTAGDTNTRFIAIPGDVQFRPQRLTRKPRVQGLLSAVVDGDDAGQPLLNQNGCYKVIFPFIRSDKGATRGSAWLRMASMSSGASHGMHFPLLKGTEVLVSFIGGDPDRPVITGSVPNSENPNMVNEKNATQSGLSTPGGHYLAMEDNPSGALMKMGAPAGNTEFTLGNGDVSGAHLRTDNHMQLASSTHEQQVGSFYKFSATGPSPAPSSASNASSAPYQTPDDSLGKAVETNKKEKADTAKELSAAKTEQTAAQKEADEADSAYKEHPTEANKTAKEKADEKLKEAKEKTEKLEKKSEELDEESEKLEKEKERQEQITALLPTKELVDSHWGGPAWANFGAKVSWNNARTVTVELNTAVEQFEVNAGFLKQEANAHAMINELNICPLTTNFKFGAEKEWHNGHKELSVDKEVEHLTHDLRTAVTSLTAEVHTLQAGLANIQAAIGIMLQVGGNSINVTQAGITLSSAIPIILDGNVSINGSLNVATDLVVTGKADITDLNVIAAMDAPEATIGELNASFATFGGAPYVPVPPNLAPGLAAAEAKIAQLAADIEIQAQLAVAKALEQATEEAVRPMSPQALAMYM